MTVEEFNAQNPSDAVLPWWPWVISILMVIGTVLAMGVYARQGWHMAENHAAALDLKDVSEEVRVIRMDVKQLRSDAEALKSSYLLNRQRIMAVETNVENPDEYVPGDAEAIESEHDPIGVGGRGDRSPDDRLDGSQDVRRRRTP